MKNALLSLSRNAYQMDTECLPIFIYDIVAEIAEIGSGLSLNRPGIREMAGLAHRHMIDAVLVSDISRLCRDCGQTLRLEGKLKKQGVSIESIKGNPLPEYRRARIALGCIMK